MILKELRENAGYETMKELANAIGIPYPTYRQYELGLRFPGEKFIIMIANFYDVSLDTLFERQYKFERK